MIQRRAAPISGIYAYRTNRCKFAICKAARPLIRCRIADAPLVALRSRYSVAPSGSLVTPYESDQRHHIESIGLI